MKKLILLILLSFCFPAAGQAQENQIFIPPGTNYDNTGAKVRQFLKEQSFEKTTKLPVGSVEVSITHPDYLESDQFALLMKKKNSVTGCFEYSPLEYEAKYIEPYYMDVTLKHYRRTLKETQNPSFDCSTTSQVISGMIIFSAKDLAARKVSQIRFSNGNTRDTYTVSVRENSVRLTPESMVAFKAVGLQGPDKSYLEYHFGDNSLITLQVPMAKDGEDVAQAVRDLAYRSALQPVFEREGLDTSGKDNVFYFIDSHGKTLEQIGKDGYAEFGTIQVNRPYDGPDGRVGLPVPLKVFLTRPNVTL